MGDRGIFVFLFFMQTTQAFGENVSVRFWVWVHICIEQIKVCKYTCPANLTYPIQRGLFPVTEKENHNKYCQQAKDHLPAM